MLFRVKEKVGAHRENGKVYRAGDVLNSHLPLDKMWPSKFSKVDAIAAVKAPSSDFPTFPIPQAPASEIPAPVIAGGKDKGKYVKRGKGVPKGVPKGSPNKEELPKDITSQFPMAASRDVQVFSVNGIFRAVDSDQTSLVLAEFASADALSKWLVGEKD